jgi:hypothetical protein
MRPVQPTPHPPSVVDSRRPLFNAAFRSSVARSRNAWNNSQRESGLVAVDVPWHPPLA